MADRKMFLYRRRWPVILGAVVLIGIAAFYGSGLVEVLKGSDFSVPGSDSVKAGQILDTSLHGGTPDVVILMQADGLHPTDPAFRSAAQSLLAALSSYQEVSSITSYYSTGSNRFLSKDGRETFAIVQLSSTDESVKEHEYTTLEPLLVAPPLHLTVGGVVPFNLQVNQQVIADVGFAEMITFPLVLILLVLVFRGVIAALLPLLIGAATITCAFALLRLFTNITPISSLALNAVTGPGLGLAIDYALLIVTRFRQELAHSNRDVPQALRKTMSTAGRAVIFSGLTVSVSLLGFFFFPETFLRSLGLGIISAVVLAMLCSLTILPAILALLGSRVNLLSFGKPARQVPYAPDQQHQQGAWASIAETVMRRPVPVIIGVVALLLTLGYPFLNVSFYIANFDPTILPADAPTRIASDHLTHDFAQQGSSQVVIAVTTSGNVLSASNLARLEAYVRQIENLAGVVSVDSLVTIDPSLSLEQYQQLYRQPKLLNPQLASVVQQLANGPKTKVTVFMQPADFSADALNLVHKIRTLSPPRGLTPLVDGPTPRQIDLFGSIQATIPLALAVIVVSIFLLLFLMTGSILVPLKAVVLNFLSLTATFGALVWIFQEGHFQDVLNFQTSGHIDGTLPVLIFGIAFGLSMDYEVFLLSRIKEEYDATGNNRWAVSSGLQQTGGLITSAALLLAVVLGAFSLSRIVFIKSVGVGLVIAILMDATIIRVLLVPATMRLLGEWNWWAPRPLQALWLRIGLAEAPRGERPGDILTSPVAGASDGQAIMGPHPVETCAEKGDLAGTSNVISTLTANSADIMGPEILVWRYPEDEVQNGSRLLVGYNHFCILKFLGTIVSVYEPGQHVVRTCDSRSFDVTQLSFSGEPIRWDSEVFYINGTRLRIKTSGITLSREMTEMEYSVDYSIHVATREDAIRLLEHMPHESHILITRDIYTYTGPMIKQVLHQFLRVTPLEQVDTKISDLSQLIHQQLQSFLPNYGMTLDEVQVLVTPRYERISGFNPYYRT